MGALLLIETRLVLAATREGHCPGLNSVIDCKSSNIPVDSCTVDKNCTRVQKCCPTDCGGNQCMDPVKKGACPVTSACDPSRPESPFDHCLSDNVCDALYKCCPVGCTGSICVNPVMKKPRSCPRFDSTVPDYYCARQCSDDFDCLGNLVCCFNGCSWQCY